MQAYGRKRYQEFWTSKHMNVEECTHLAKLEVCLRMQIHLGPQRKRHTIFRTAIQADLRLQNAVHNASEVKVTMYGADREPCLMEWSRTCDGAPLVMRTELSRS